MVRGTSCTIHNPDFYLDTCIYRIWKFYNLHFKTWNPREERLYEGTEFIVSNYRRKIQHQEHYLVASVLVPHKRHVFRDSEGSIFIEKIQLTATPKSPSQLDNNRIVLAVARFKEEIEHPTGNTIPEIKKRQTQWDRYQEGNQIWYQTLYILLH